MKKERQDPSEFGGRRKPEGPQNSLHPPQLHSLPHLMRLTVLIPLQAHRLVLSPRLSTNPTDGVSTGNIVMSWTITLETRVLTRRLPAMPEIHNLFTRHRLEWTARSLGRYSE